jgi:hypothetical protein
LKGLPIIAYYEDFNFKGRCVVDTKAWDTAIDLVANQSTKLKLMRFADYEKRPDTTVVPRLHFTLIPIDIDNGCAAIIRADVIALLQGTPKIIPSGVSIIWPDYDIWSVTWTVKAPYQSFSKFAIEASEQIVKRLVNDWAASQDLP